MFWYKVARSMELMRYYPPGDPRPEGMDGLVLGDGIGPNENYDLWWRVDMTKTVLRDRSKGMHKSVYFDPDGYVIGRSGTR